MKPRARLGRPQGRSLSAALLACSDVSGELHAVARRTLVALLETHRNDREQLAVHLGVTTRTVRRVCSAYGMQLPSVPPKRHGNPAYRRLDDTHAPRVSRRLRQQEIP